MINKNFIAGFIASTLVFLFLISFVLIPLNSRALDSYSESISELQVRIGEYEEETVGFIKMIEETHMDALIFAPVLYFDRVRVDDSWEEIEAVPYSICYLHTAEVGTFDFIMCKAK